MGSLTSLVPKAAAEPSLSENNPLDPPKETFEHGESAVGVKVAGGGSLARVHHLKVHEHRHVDADGFVAEETDGLAGGAR